VAGVLEHGLHGQLARPGEVSADDELHVNAFELDHGVVLHGFGVFSEEYCKQEIVYHLDGAFVSAELLDYLFEMDVAFRIEVGGLAVDSSYFKDVVSQERGLVLRLLLHAFKFRHLRKII